MKKNEGKNINSFKKFSEMNGVGKLPKEVKEDVVVPMEQTLPANPNLPTKSTKIPKGADTKNIMPKKDVIKESESKVKLYGKVAHLPKGTKASKGFNFLENVKISKNSIWYIMVERMDNSGGELLQMVKYNYKKGVDLSKFINELKSHYTSVYKDNPIICKSINNIKIEGNDKYSSVSCIPSIEIDGKKIITKITEDLIKLLSK